MNQISIPLGIFFGLLASFVQSLGLTIQRKSHVLNQRLPEHEQRLEHRRPLWILGLGIFISSNILGSLVQIASLPVVILAPLGAVSLLWNAFFARLILGDVFSSWMILATLFIAGGAVLIAIFGIVPEPTRSLEDLLDLFRRPTFVVYFSLLGVVVFVSLAITHFTEYRFNRRIAQTVTPLSESPSDITPPMVLEAPTNPSVLNTGVTDTVTDAMTNERTPLLDSKSRDSSRTSSFLSVNKYATPSQIRSINRTRLLLAISYASFSGIISGMCLLFAKSGVELLLLTVQGQNQFWRWQSWILVLSLIIFALLQLWYLHKGLILADPTLVCPSAFCFYNLSSIVNGLVYFDQFSLISRLHLSLVALGIIILLVGVWVVSIQAGGEGTLDVPWAEESALDEEEEGAIEDEAVLNSRELESDANVNADRRSPSIEWGTRSEPMIGLGRPLSPLSTTSQPLLSPESSQLSPPNIRSSAHRRRPTTVIDTRHIRAPSNTQYNTLINNSNNQHSRPPLSPTLPTVSTLAGTGFQIGLSPFSPGFSVVPLERKRRISSHFGSGLSASTGGVNPGAAGSGARSIEGERRRTVSEGDIKQGTMPLARHRDSEVRNVFQSESVEESGEDSNEVEAPSIGIGKGKGKEFGSRRSWWQRISRR
ncbi:hypothetical protein J3R30DRAFT_3655388 [Lentinula aciculospora]|uniref:DUF803-domain-containing protein n=1 Tax=Lentinula aciculospora TaxID=153920 RepID=A0A9W9AP11_9AGAR|nr:hypothetical protein J3R30DRAFT_3655388 [Lentinula aciculospora]